MTPESERVFRRGLLATVVLAAGLVALLTCDAHSQEVSTSDPALICGKVDGMSYSRQHRKLLLEDERRAEFEKWGISWPHHRDYVIDHPEPLCLGGADTPANRRPQRCTQWRGIECIDGPAAKKDRIEWQACADVCGSYHSGDGANYVAIKLKGWQSYFANWKDW